MKSLKKPTITLLKITLAFLILFNLIKSKDEDSEYVSIHDLNDSDFDSQVNNGTKNPWFVIFYIDSCPHCKNAKQTLSSISNNPDSISKSKIRLGKVDCDSNMFTCYRFKISRVPYIVIIDSNQMYELNEYPSKENLVNFINLKKDSEEGIDIPHSVGYLEFFYKSLEELINLVNSNIEGYLKKSLEIEVEWKSEYTIGLLALSLVLIIVVEYTILSIICKVPGSKKKKENSIKSDENNDNKNESKEIKDKIKNEEKTQEEENIESEKNEKEKKDD